MTHPFRFLAPAALALLLMIPSCSKPESPEPTQDQLERYYVNTFACNTMRNYYLWADEIADGLEAWKTDEEPVGKVRALRYKDSAGEEVDRWTRLYEDFDTFYNGVNGKRTSYGLSYKLYYTDKTRSRIMAVVTYTYAGGPARQAGLKRGDIILEVNGKTLTPDNYQQVSAGELSGGESVTLTFADGSRKTLESARLYEDPILLTRIFDCQGKKVGYLHYTSFTLDSCQQLIDLCRSFKGREVTELILDLRYNGGGYALTEEVLASMLAPEQEVLAGSILATEVYNSTLMEISGMQSTPLTMDYSIEDEKGKTLFSTRGANIGITRLAIVDSGTASRFRESVVRAVPLSGHRPHRRTDPRQILQRADGPRHGLVQTICRPARRRRPGQGLCSGLGHVHGDVRASRTGRRHALHAGRAGARLPGGGQPPRRLPARRSAGVDARQ